MSMTTFVVGPPGHYQSVRFDRVFVDGSPNVLAADPLPPLNVNGMRRLAKHLLALADLVEYGQGHRVDPDQP